jgi:simple sugar transport system permease protein
MLLAAGVGVVVSILLLTVIGADAFGALGALISGSVGSSVKLADTVMAWSPVVLAAAGLVITFRAGLWNIGVEGQLIAGAIAATGVARSMGGPGWIVILLSLIAGLLGGAVWGLAAGLLRVYGNVNEIFGGLGLGYVAQAVATYLVIGPWKRAGIASTSGTEPFREEVWMPAVGSTRLAPVAPLLAIAVVVAVWWLLDKTRFGLELKAVGSNLASARLIGMRSAPAVVSPDSLEGSS